MKSWIAWACRSRLQPFVRVAGTLRAPFIGILAYIRHRLTNGLAEGLHNKLRAPRLRLPLRCRPHRDALPQLRRYRTLTSPPRTHTMSRRGPFRRASGSWRGSRAPRLPAYGQLGPPGPP
ncbi:MAG: transposase, partial [Acidobacteria bacterium]|nr:transposase [Acidobacteriota bacterium]